MADVANIHELEALLNRQLPLYHPDPSVLHPGIALSLLGNKLAQCVRSGEPAAVAAACELIAADPTMPFGKLIKSNLARALRQRSELLCDVDRRHISQATSKLLSLASCPREIEDYCKLVRKMGTPFLETVIRDARASCPRSQKWIAYLESAS